MVSSPQKWLQLGERLITKFGRANPVTFTRRVHGSHNTTSLTHTESTAITYIAYCAPIDFKTKLLDKTILKSGDKMLYIVGVDTSGVSISPQIGDEVALEVTYKITEVLDTYETLSTNCAFLVKISV